MGPRTTGNSEASCAPMPRSRQNQVAMIRSRHSLAQVVSATKASIFARAFSGTRSAAMATVSTISSVSNQSLTRSYFLPTAAPTLRSFSSAAAQAWRPPPRPTPGKDGFEAKDKIRNVAIIAHVDHGKTTLVDCLLKQSGGYDKVASVDRVMDSIALEQERGITIMSKATRVNWNGYTLNIVDTPGHADFGGEVERVLSMVDGVILVIDATEGPMPQTKFVLHKALQHGLRPILVINKVDRTTSRIGNGEVQNEAFDLFMNLEANEEQLDFPILFASARNGWATDKIETVEKFSTAPPTKAEGNMTPLYEAIVKHVPPPVVKTQGDFSMLITSIEYDNYVGRICTGRIYSGSVNAGDNLRPVNRDGVVGESAKIMKFFVRRGTAREEIEKAVAGDIVSIAGVNGLVGDTLTNASTIAPISSPPLDSPTIAVTLSPNTAPLNGKDGGKHLTAAAIRDRLFRETENNVAIQVFPSATIPDAYEVHGRGELQMGILLETMRRELYEVSVSPPKVLVREENGKKLEPVEEVVMEIDADISGMVLDKMKQRGGTLMEYKELANNKVKVIFHCPSRTLMGYRSEFKMDTKGTGVMYSIYHSHQPVIETSSSALNRGALVSSEQGTATSYALEMIQQRGQLFIEPGTEVYEGMIIGENSRPEDMAVNPTKKKQLSNVRAVMKEDTVRLYPPRIIPLEDAITYIREDEMVEVTPKSIRLRKRILNHEERLRLLRNSKGK